jgi:hypothetical protein
MIKCVPCNKEIKSMKDVNINLTPLHKTAYCAMCGKYIKHLGKDEYDRLVECAIKDQSMYEN